MGRTIQVYGFPSRVTLGDVEKFLEKYTDKGTIYAIQLKDAKRKYAIVQFKDPQSADLIISMASRQCLFYGTSFLKARRLDRDYVPKPKVFSHDMEVTLHFGCQISDERFYVLWSRMNVSVKYGQGLKKFYLFLSRKDVDYKLELSYENIWQIQLLHHPRAQRKFLLIQLLGAPRIHEKVEQVDDSWVKFYDCFPEDQWFRTTDFSPSCSIGQSSALCMELPIGLGLPNLQEQFVYYKEKDAPFVLEDGITYSCNTKLVPIVGPPERVYLPFNILFKICVLVQSGCVSGPALDIIFYRLVDPSRIPIACIEHALEKLCHVKECCYDPVKWLQKEYRTFMESKHRPKPPEIFLDAGLVYVRRVQITPSRIYFCGPEINLSNRVLRNYIDDIDNFIRVSFVDEELDKMYSGDLYAKVSLVSRKRKTELYTRVLSTLQNGIAIGDKRFEFLAFSSSQLRDNSAWFFASRRGLTAADIRNWMGNFNQIKNVAKYAARLGQSFGSSTETLSVGQDDIEHIPDVVVRKAGITYVFSDGIGKISSHFAQKVAKKCGLKRTPSAYQIRFGGYKGVVAVDPTSRMKLSLRKSMCKYESTNRKLDVLAYTKYQPCYLNRQLITLLSTLGVRDHIFEKKQREAIQQLDRILTDPLWAQDALESMSPGESTNILKEMLMCGYKPNAEPFLAMMLQTFRASKLLDLKTKARIFVPMGRSMMGCLDETRTLEYGQVFVQFSTAPRGPLMSDSRFTYYGCGSDQQRCIVEGHVVVAKNPCLHPGDVRVLSAVDVPALHHLVDCVVFPQKGLRPHPNECSGSDLDGDIYFVCWDNDLVPPLVKDPMDYTAAPAILLDHDVSIEEVEKYFTDYMVNDTLGIIANAHTAFADKEADKAMSEPCIELAKLFSIAVDFPKTGVPAEIPSHLYVREYPDFMEKPDKVCYESKNVIGKLFRMVKDVVPNTVFASDFTREDAAKSYDPDMEYYGFEDYISDAIYYKGSYDYKLGNLMDYYGIQTEAELLTAGIMKMSKFFNRRRDTESLILAVKSLRKEARSWFNEKGSGLDSGSDDAYAKASAWYHVTYHPDYWGSYNEGLNRSHYLSFPWLVYDKLICIKEDKMRLLRVLNSQSLSDYFDAGLSIVD